MCSSDLERFFNADIVGAGGAAFSCDPYQINATMLRLGPPGDEARHNAITAHDTGSKSI